MTAQTMQIGNRPCRIYGEAHAEYLLLQMTGAHELQSMDDEVAAIAQSNRTYLFAAIPAESWNDALSPWKSPAVWGKQGFGGNAGDTLRFLTEQVVPTLKQQFNLPENVKIILGGYSLAGLLARELRRTRMVPRSTACSECERLLNCKMIFQLLYWAYQIFSGGRRSDRTDNANPEQTLPHLRRSPCRIPTAPNDRCTRAAKHG